jgi:hypothetical protein
MFYRNEAPPINLNDILDAAKATESDPNAYHNAVKYRPDSWGFAIEGIGKHGGHAIVYLRLYWAIDGNPGLPRYARLKHIKRILEKFQERLGKLNMIAAYDPMDLEISISIEDKEVQVSQRIEVLRIPDFLGLQESEEAA